jgi:hypothetical protein
MSLIHRAVTALVSSALAVSLVATGEPAQAAAAPSSPGGHGATWLAGQLNAQGLIHNPNFVPGGFDDYGLTIDTAFALKAIGGHKKDVATVRKALSKHVDSYTTGVDFGTTDVFAGAVAKLLVLTQQTGGGARAFGGVNLVRRLDQRVITSGPSKGRIQDVVDPTNPFGADSANAIGQIFAVRGLMRAGRTDGAAALRFLLQQQCDSGFFRLNFTADKAAADQACGKGDPADTDVTALAVVELASVAKGHRRLNDALGAATRWLKRRENANGSFGGSGPTSAANANSTGLAGWAFLTEGLCGAARDAAGWLSNRQLKGHLAGTPLAGERGAVGYDNATLRAAEKDGISKETRDRWRRATAQAAPALLALTRCTP